MTCTCAYIQYATAHGTEIRPYLPYILAAPNAIVYRFLGAGDTAVAVAGLDDTRVIQCLDTRTPRNPSPIHTYPSPQITRYPLPSKVA